MAHQADRLWPMITRRAFSGIVSTAVLARPSLAAPKLTLHVGHTGLTWIPLGGSPVPKPAINPMADPQYVEAAIRDISALGFYGIELFGDQIEAIEEHRGISSLLDRYRPPLISAYCSTNLMDSAGRQDARPRRLAGRGL